MNYLKQANRIYMIPPPSYAISDLQTQKDVHLSTGTKQARQVKQSKILGRSRILP